MRHERFALARSEGRTIGQAAEEAGISERHGKRWDDDERVIALANRFRRERINRIAAKAARQVENWLDTESLPSNQLIDLFKSVAVGDVKELRLTGAEGGPLAIEITVVPSRHAETD